MSGNCGLMQKDKNVAHATCVTQVDDTLGSIRCRDQHPEIKMQVQLMDCHIHFVITALTRISHARINSSWVFFISVVTYIWCLVCYPLCTIALLNIHILWCVPSTSRTFRIMISVFQVYVWYQIRERKDEHHRIDTCTVGICEQHANIRCTL